MYNWNLQPQATHYQGNSQGANVHRSNTFPGASNSAGDGSIVLVTPELGRWSTVGGLGVMVNELSIGFAELGHDVYVISPYYEYNRKGEKDYLARDPDTIRYTRNVEVEVEGKKVVVGLHEGVVSGVKVIFLHNTGAFHKVYHSNGAKHAIYQSTVFAKCCMEVCCQKKVQPTIFVTNDWYTGFCAGYACLLYTSPSPRDGLLSRMPSSA